MDQQEYERPDAISSRRRTRAAPRIGLDHLGQVLHGVGDVGFPMAGRIGDFGCVAQI